MSISCATTPPGQLPDCQPVECEELRGVREHQLDSGAHKEVPQVRGAERGGQQEYSKGKGCTLSALAFRDPIRTRLSVLDSGRALCDKFAGFRRDIYILTSPRVLTEPLRFSASLCSVAEATSPSRRTRAATTWCARRRCGAGLGEEHTAFLHTPILSYLIVVYYLILSCRILSYSILYYIILYYIILYCITMLL